MSDPIPCPECRHSIDIHEAGRECLNCSTAKWLGSPIPPCALSPSDIAREYKEGYGRWKEAGRGYHRVLLSIWRALTPDSEHMTFGDDPEAVFETLEDAWAAEPTEAEVERAAEALWRESWYPDGSEWWGPRWGSKDMDPEVVSTVKRQARAALKAAREA